MIESKSCRLVSLTAVLCVHVVCARVHCERASSFFLAFFMQTLHNAQRTCAVLYRDLYCSIRQAKRSLYLQCMAGCYATHRMFRCTTSSFVGRYCNFLDKASSSFERDRSEAMACNDGCACRPAAAVTKKQQKKPKSERKKGEPVRGKTQKQG